MRQFIKLLLAAWLTGSVMGAGCFCGAVGTGLIVRKPHVSQADCELMAAQILEIQDVLERLEDSGLAGGGW